MVSQSLSYAPGYSVYPILIYLPVRGGCRPEYGENCSDASLSRTGRVCRLMPENTVQKMLWSSPLRRMSQHAGGERKQRGVSKEDSLRTGQKTFISTQV